MHLTVSGRVQGVGFRLFVLRQAEEAGVRGWVRNLADGRVEIRAQGRPHAVEALTSAVRQGPRHAQVDTVEGKPVPVEETGRGFEVRR